MQSLLGNTRKPDVSFYRSGRIDITSNVAKILHLQSGDVIDVAKNEKDFFLYIKHKAKDIIGKHEAQCFGTNKGKECHNFRCYSARLCYAILTECHANECARLPIGEAGEFNGQPIVPIITRNNLTK